jgi:hypothetical protein
VIKLELVHRDLTLLVLDVSRRQKSRWTPRKYQTSTDTSARQRELSFGLTQMVISPRNTVSITTIAQRSPSSAKNDRFPVLDASSVTYPSCPSRPELTKWPITTHKRTDREHDGLIVALDQAFRDFRVFSKGWGRLTEIKCFPSLRHRCQKQGRFAAKT